MTDPESYTILYLSCSKPLGNGPHWRAGVTYEVKAWLDEHIGEEVKNHVDWLLKPDFGAWRYVGMAGRINAESNTVQFWFRSEKDAVLFKLTWGGE